MKALIVEPVKGEKKLGVDLKAACKSSFDSDEMQMYLNKLTHLVPNTPKHRKLTKLEVIQCVIDYICDLEDTLMARQIGVKPNTVLSEKQNTLHPNEMAADDRQS